MLRRQLLLLLWRLRLGGLRSLGLGLLSILSWGALRRLGVASDAYWTLLLLLMVVGDAAATTSSASAVVITTVIIMARHIYL